MLFFLLYIFKLDEYKLKYIIYAVYFRSIFHKAMLYFDKIDGEKQKLEENKSKTGRGATIG